jgi:branched-chain amino acid aminotransferase
MESTYDNRDGVIWMDGKLLNWREANVHILTHAMHYASSVF